MLRSSEFQSSGPLHNMRPFWEYVWDVKSRGTGELKVSEDTHTLWKKEHKDTWGTYDWEGRKALSHTWKSILLLVLMKLCMFAGFRAVDMGTERHPKYWYDMTNKGWEIITKNEWDVSSNHMPKAGSSHVWTFLSIAEVLGCQTWNGLAPRKKIDGK